MDFNGNQKFKRTSCVSTKQVEDELLLLHLETGDYFSLNSIGHQIWDYCVEAKSAEEVIKFVMSQYECSEEKAKKDVQDYFETLIREKIFEIV